ncbi:MAG: type II toxin-antitoxin system RelE/ParE family toxin [Phenylobacterium sp.]|uniref:type II toxin-antitoxin system RelE/ParE family toxin n=1 Tax=Phenylobacterium sp. TaxID=1871053 RepID=UPI001A3A6BB5|nr:type II toxin-antitoxin system RelE/ParE family toxin [Phenylobacterium sp.]MBL8556531.1 type II toxin-antitoxin system RelE/ParE family toxin [Phenylobacterium sp.]
MFGEAQADRYLADLYDAFDLLAANPRIARDRTEFRRPVRVHPFKAHVIVYRADGDDVLILRLRHGREDWLGSPAAND